MITAHNFAASTISAGFNFGLGGVTHTARKDDNPAFAKELRRIADEIDAGNVLPQKVTVLSTAEPEEFVTTTVTLHLVEKVKQ